MCVYGIYYNKTVPYIWIILSSLLGYIHVYYFIEKKKKSNEIESDILIGCYSVMFPKTEIRQMKRWSMLYSFPHPSSLNALSDTRRDSFIE